MSAKTVFSLLCTVSMLYTGELRVTSASVLVYALKEIKKEFKKENPDQRLSISFSSSGKAYTQIVNGAPYDIFFSANMEYPKKLYRKGFAISEPKPYAYGRIGLWVPRAGGVDPKKGVEILTDPKVKKIAIANPLHAPYGAAAIDVLKNRKLYEKIRHKLVMGENISQAAQFVQSGAADAGILPVSLVCTESLRSSGDFYLFPAGWHKPIIQGYVVLKKGADNPAAKRFEAFVQSKTARKIFNMYGFRLPDE